MDKAKPFAILKREVWLAFKKVKANQGAAGVDGQSIVDFEADLSNNLYKLWNRMSSGSYVPPPVRRVDIPKGDSKTETRPLGVPTVADRIAQEVVKRYLEPVLEPIFHKDSYGYRPGRSAVEAVRMARQRCWRYDWVLDVDVRSYFDSIDWELLLKAVRKHTDCRWVLLYIERWLKAPVQLEDGSVVPRTAGTPQGGVVSPCLSNLFLHYVFDMWMVREFPTIPFERYADDIICHCRSAEEAQALWSALEARVAACRLALHPQKTKLVYCKDANRREDYPTQSFDFLGYEFRPRSAIWRGRQLGVSFPARRKSESAEGNPADGSSMGTPSTERQGPRRSSQDVQSIHSRLDQLLWPLLQIDTAAKPAADRCLPGSLGPLQVQAAPGANVGSTRLVCTGRPRQPSSLCSLALAVCRRLNIGSRMSREAHVRI